MMTRRTAHTGGVQAGVAGPQGGVLRQGALVQVPQHRAAPAHRGTRASSAAGTISDRSLVLYTRFQHISLD